MTTGRLIIAPGGDGDLPATRAAVQAAGELVQQAWIQLASAAVGHGAGEYLAGLQGPDSLRYPLDGDPLAVAVFNVAPHAAALEDGFAPFNLASRIDWGRPKVKHGKNGPYLIIPFQHFTPGATAASSRRRSMPAGVYAVARHLKAGERIQLNPGSGPAVPIHQGERVVGSRSGRTVTPANQAPFVNSRRLWVRGQPIMQHPGAHPSPESSTGARALGHPPGMRASPSIFEGMQKSGGRYVTMRVIKPTSSWIIPGRPGLHLAERVTAMTEAKVRALIAAALVQDARDAIAEALSGG